MRFTKVALASGFLLLIGSIVVPGSSPVNHNSVLNGVEDKTQLADGMPLPVPHVVTESTLVADGMPLPVPHALTESTLVADGMPLPVPHAVTESTLVADGMPLPVPHAIVEVGSPT